MFVDYILPSTCQIGKRMLNRPIRRMSSSTNTTPPAFGYNLSFVYFVKAIIATISANVEKHIQWLQ